MPQPRIVLASSMPSHTAAALALLFLVYGSSAVSRHIGCIRGASPFVLSTRLRVHRSHSPQACARACYSFRFPYSAVRSDSACFCGRDITKSAVLLENTRCHGSYNARQPYIWNIFFSVAAPRGARLVRSTSECPLKRLRIENDFPDRMWTLYRSGNRYRMNDVTFNVIVNVTSGTVFRLRINFGDNSSHVGVYRSSDVIAVNHSYTEAGDYEVTARASLHDSSSSNCSLTTNFSHVLSIIQEIGVVRVELDREIVAVGDDVHVIVVVEGGSHLTLDVHFGNGSVFHHRYWLSNATLVEESGRRISEIRLRHVYRSSGQFNLRAIASNPLGSADDERVIFAYGTIQSVQLNISAAFLHQGSHLFLAAFVSPFSLTDLDYVWLVDSVVVNRTQTPFHTLQFLTNGTYNVAVEARNPVSRGVSVAHQVSVISTMSNQFLGMTLSVSDSFHVTGSLVSFTVIVVGVVLERIEWSFGDGTTRTTSTPSTSHRYASPGRFVVIARAFGQIGNSIQATTSVEVIGCPPVTFSGVSPVKVIPSGSLVIEAVVNASCSGESMESESVGKPTFTWRILDQSATTYWALSTTTSTLYLERHDLNKGSYFVIVRVSFFESGLSAVGRITLLVEPNLVDSVSSGQTQTISRFGGSLYLFPEQFFSPEDLTSLGYDRTLRWDCTVADDPSLSCFADSLEGSLVAERLAVGDLTIDIPSDVFANGFRHFLFGVVWNATELSAIPLLHVVVEDAHLPDDDLLLSIRCSQCKGFQVSAARRISLEANCHNCDDAVFFSWQLVVYELPELPYPNETPCYNSTLHSRTKPPLNSFPHAVTQSLLHLAEPEKMSVAFGLKLNVREISLDPDDTVLGTHSKLLVLKENVLLSNQIVAFNVTATMHDGARVGSSLFGVFTYAPPYGGRCHVSPSSGIELLTTFTVVCSNWSNNVSPDCSLTYVVYYADCVDGKENRTLIYSGRRSTSSFSLAASQSGLGCVWIEIVDSYGATTELCPFEIAVSPLVVGGGGVKPEDYIKSIAANSSGLVGRAVTGGDDYGIAYAVCVVAVVMNSRLAETTDDDDVQLRRALRLFLIGLLESVPIYTETIADTALAALANCLAKEVEIDVDAVDVSARIADNVATVLWHKANFGALLNGRVLTSTARATSSSLVARTTSTTEFVNSMSIVLQGYMRSRELGETIQRRVGFVAFAAAKVNRVDYVETMRGDIQAVFRLPAEVEEIVSREDDFKRSSRGVQCLSAFLSTYERNPYLDLPDSSSTLTNVTSLEVTKCDGRPVEVSHLQNPIRLEILLNHNPLLDEAIAEYVLNESSSNAHVVAAPRPALWNHSLNVELTLSNDNDVWIRVKQTNHNFLNFSQAVRLERNVPYSVSLFPANASHTITLSSMQTKGPVRYRFLTWWSNCVFWDEFAPTPAWSSDGCTPSVDGETTLYSIVCYCNHLTSFAGSIELAPNRILINVSDFDETMRRSFAAMALLVFLLSAYVTSIVIVKRSESKSRRRGALFLDDNEPSDKQRYEIVVETGELLGSGTTARVSVVLFGGDRFCTTTRELVASSETAATKLFRRNSIDGFLLTTPSSLGALTTLHVWHDNGGASPSWYLNRVVVRDLTTDECAEFPCYDWLSAENGGPKRELRRRCADATAPVAAGRFAAEMKRIFPDSHLWSSLFLAPLRSRFSRVQRLTCVLSLLLVMMAVTASWAQAPTRLESKFIVFGVSLRTLFVACVANAFSLPVTILWIQLFQRRCRRCRRKQKRIDKRRRFPCVWVVVAWIGCFVTCAASIAFVFIFSVNFDKGATISSLLTLLCCLLQSLLMFEPLKVFVSTLYVKFSKKAAATAKEREKAPLTFSSTPKGKIATKKPPIDETTFERKRRTKFNVSPTTYELMPVMETVAERKKMWKAIKEGLDYFLFFLLLIVIVYSRRPRGAFQIRKPVNNLWKAESFDSISSREAWWEWAKGPLSKTNATLANPFKSAHFVLLSNVRLRQFRQTETSYGDPNGLWNFTEFKGSGEIQGRFASYSSGGGFVIDLKSSSSDAINQILFLQRSGWVDRKTLSIVAEYVAYHPAWNTFTFVGFVAEFDAVGGVHASRIIRTARLSYHQLPSDLVVTILEITLFVLVVYRTAKGVARIRKFRLGFLLDLHFLGETLKIFHVWIVLMHYLSIVIDVPLLFDRLKNGRNVPIEDWHSAIENELKMNVVYSAVIFFAFLMLIKLLRYFSSGSFLYAIFRHAALPTFHLMLAVCLLVFVFGQFAHVVFGSQIGYFSSLRKSFLSLFLITPRGIFSSPELTSHPVSSFFFFAPLSFLVSTGTFAMLFAIFKWSVRQARQDTLRTSIADTALSGILAEPKSVVRRLRPKPIASWEDLERLVENGEPDMEMEDIELPKWECDSTWELLPQLAYQMNELVKTTEEIRTAGKTGKVDHVAPQSLEPVMPLSEVRRPGRRYYFRSASSLKRTSRVSLTDIDGTFLEESVRKADSRTKGSSFSQWKDARLGRSQSKGNLRKRTVAVVHRHPLVKSESLESLEVLSLQWEPDHPNAM